jgi:hypothetical protein
MIVYIAGPYAANESGSIDDHIALARDAALKVWEAGHFAMCPHLNTSHFEEDSELTNKDYVDRDLWMVARCDAIVMLPGWQESRGATRERDYATVQDIPVYFFPDIPAPHPTEVLRPIQAEAFVNTVMKMYRVHLDKNADYSPANILGVGEIGLVTRLWDKMARLLNLVGFRMEIASSRFEAPLKPKNESIDDNLMDMAVYAIIGQLLRKGKWGK